MSTASRPAVPDGRYQVTVNQNTYEIDVKGGAVVLNGAPVAFSFEPLGKDTYSLLVEGRSLTVTFVPAAAGQVRISMAGRELTAQVKDQTALLLERFGVAAGNDKARREVHAPMPGLVVKLMVEAGQEVKAGTGLLILEAMKMENELRASVDGVIRAIHVGPGDAVGKNQLLIEFES